MNTPKDVQYLKQAITLSQRSVTQGGYPVGALLVLDNKVLGEGISDGKQQCDATSHAEIDAIRNASRSIQKRNLTGATLYTSYEPCLMCFSASFWAYIHKIVYAIRKESSPQNFNEGTHDIAKINMHNRRTIELVHMKELEQEAISVITAWKKKP